MKQLLGKLLLTYFRVLAKIQLKKNRSAQIIGITGSAGKTSALEATAAVLSESGRVNVGRKANSESGIPLHILGLQPQSYSFLDWLRLAIAAPAQLLLNWERFDYFILEMGIDGPHEPKNMEYLLKIVKPDVGVFLCVGAMHTQQFDAVVTESDPKKRVVALKKAIAQEKAKIITRLTTGIGVISADDSFVTEATESAKVPLRTFGFSEQADLVCTNVTWTKNGTTFSFASDDATAECKIKGYYLPKHYGATLAAALITAENFGLSLYKGCQMLEKHLRIPPGRATLFTGKKGSSVLDSSYNSSAQPLKDILAMVPELPFSHHVLVLGDMRELGSASESEHTAIATTICTSSKLIKKLKHVVLVGPEMTRYVEPILSKNSIPTSAFPTAGKAIATTTQLLDSTTLVTVKGSQNTIFLEILVESLLASAQDRKKLCRRGPFWDEQRKAFTDQ